MPGLGLAGRWSEDGLSRRRGDQQLGWCGSEQVGHGKAPQQAGDASLRRSRFGSYVAGEPSAQGPDAERGVLAVLACAPLEPFDDLVVRVLLTPDKDRQQGRAWFLHANSLSAKGSSDDGMARTARSASPNHANGRNGSAMTALWRTNGGEPAFVCASYGVGAIATLRGRTFRIGL
ncbi:hypothetical protein Psuf_028300 [Phytohabitans suffuscus]|uniref:Uncharacterized protein n=2 Tax=Phytohabitans suffuscus TaxID=624315 RepID=A0A6F8YHH9_9ACTN|nr:hypothetical protein Psuf_028300 [Phytohabitans suffuscus]